MIVNVNLRNLTVVIKFLFLLYILSCLSACSSNRNVNLYVFLGPPCAGKGTLAQTLKQQGYSHLSTGDLLRNEVKNETYLGKKFRKEIEDGSILIPDHILEEIIEKHVLKATNEGKNIIMDGFPKTIEQAYFLKKISKKYKIHNLKCILFSLTEQNAFLRSKGRYSCVNCGYIYNIDRDNLKENQSCDHCQGTLIHRMSDNPKSIRRKIDFFNSTSKVLIDFYKKENALIVLDGNNTKKKILQNFDLLIKKTKNI